MFIDWSSASFKFSCIGYLSKLLLLHHSFPSPSYSLHKPSSQWLFFVGIYAQPTSANETSTVAGSFPKTDLIVCPFMSCCETDEISNRRPSCLWHLPFPLWCSSLRSVEYVWISNSRRVKHPMMIRLQRCPPSNWAYRRSQCEIHRN